MNNRPKGHRAAHRNGWADQMHQRNPRPNRWANPPDPRGALPNGWNPPRNPWGNPPNPRGVLPNVWADPTLHWNPPHNPWANPPNYRGVPPNHWGAAPNHWAAPVALPPLLLRHPAARYYRAPVPVPPVAPVPPTPVAPVPPTPVAPPPAAILPAPAAYHQVPHVPPVTLVPSLPVPPVQVNTYFVHNAGAPFHPSGAAGLDSRHVVHRQALHRQGAQGQVFPPLPNEDALVKRLQRQLDFYFSKENLLKDTYLRHHNLMDQGGWVRARLVMDFNEIQKILKRALSEHHFYLCDRAAERCLNIMVSADRTMWRPQLAAPFPGGWQLPKQYIVPGPRMATSNGDGNETS
ncbi:hypothetical protein ACOMHN_023082 [Nucella lapillus]